MSIEDQFQKGINFVQNSTDTKLSNEAKLRFYALYKVAMHGKCTTKAPSRFKIVEYAKWKAYDGLGDKYTKDQAMKVYVEELTQMIPKWNTTAKL